MTTLPETKQRKEFFSPFFSKNAIQRVEPLLHRQKLSLFLDTLRKAATSCSRDARKDERMGGESGSVVDFYLGFRCLTADTVMDYCFQDDMNTLSEPGFRSKTIEAMIEGFDMATMATYFPKCFAVLNTIIFKLPESIREKYFTPVYGFQTMQRLARERVEDLTAQKKKGEMDMNKKIPTMFDAMLDPDVSKGQLTPSKRDMVADGCLMIAAGTDTTANVLGTILWHVTQNPSVEARLLEELQRGMPDRDVLLDSANLEGSQFPYLHAVVKEGLRLGYGVPGRIIRKVPKEGTMIDGMFIPGGVSYSDR